MEKKSGIDFNSIRTRITLILLLAGALIISATAFFGFKIFEKTLVAEIGSNRSDVLSQIGDRVRQTKNNAFLISNLYYYDGNLRELMDRYQAEETAVNEEALMSYLNELDSQYKKALYDGDLAYDVHLILENGWGYDSAAADRRERGMKPKNKIWYKDILQAGGEIVDVANIKDPEDGRNYYCAARIMYDQEEHPAAYLIITVDERKLYNMYYRVVSEDSTLYIVDGEGTIISSSNEKINGFNFFNMANLEKLFGSEEYTITRMQGEDILFTRYRDPDSGFSVMEEIRLSTLLEPIRRVRLNMILMASSILLAAAVCAYILGSHVSRPLSRLCDFIQGIDGEHLMEKCDVGGYTEISILSEKVNFLLVKIQMLLESSRQKEQQKRKLELGFLQAQINPHFMYNTLFSVKCMVEMNRNQEAAGMLASFIQLLRSTLSNPNEFVTVRQEFDILRQYAEIQQFRYNNGFQVEFECGEEAGRQRIPKLLVQPLLENAVFHGVELRQGDGLIIVVARIREGNLEISVEDNGVGISPEIIEKLERGENVSGKTQIGIQNVKERIQLNFGTNYGMKIESRQWEGTKITLILPVLE